MQIPVALISLVAVIAGILIFMIPRFIELYCRDFDCDWDPGIDAHNGRGWLTRDNKQ